MAVLGFPEGTDFHQPLRFFDDAGASINLTGATSLQCLIVQPPKTILFTLTVGAGITVTNPTLGEVRITLTAADTQGLAGQYKFEASAILASGDTVLLGRGDLHIDATFVGA